MDQEVHVLGYHEVHEQLRNGDKPVREEDAEAYRDEQQFPVSQTQVGGEDYRKQNCGGYYESHTDDYVKKFNVHGLGNLRYWVYQRYNLQ